uniref:Uncharacterized protein n=1 Tax=Lepeophtheirus salmonis TaxID=72036 RepID=A0A0K2U9I6_LEPSM
MQVLTVTLFVPKSLTMGLKVLGGSSLIMV